MSKYEYCFVKINVKRMKWSNVEVEAEKDYHKVIEDYAFQGWRLVQIFAPSVGTHGTPTYYELIFEKEKLP